MNGEICRLRTQLSPGRNGSDHTALRLRLTRLLGSVELRPAAMPPSAILFVRHLSDPLPGHLAPWRSPVRVDTAWERATQNALAEIARRAARPGQGQVPASAEAVLFADEGEMLACLALDMSRGEAQGRWWWRAMLRTLPSSSSAGLTTLLCSRAESVPAALYHLAKRRQAVTVVNALSPQQAMTVLSAMGHAYAVDDIGTHLFRPMEPASGDAPGAANVWSERHTPESGQPHFGDSAVHHRPSDLATSTVSAPWERWLSPSSVPQSLGKERHCLLGVGLALYHEPAVVRTSRFLQRFREWWLDQVALSAKKKDLPPEQFLFTERQELVGVDTPPTAFPQVSHIGENSEGEDLPDVEPSRSRPPDLINKDGTEQAINPAAEGELPEPTRPGRKHAVSPLAVGESTQENGRHLQTEPPETVQTIVEESAESIATDHPQGGGTQSASAEETAARLAGGVDTQLGGVFYLINLMCHLDLLACFEEEWGLASQLGAWSVLDVLGRGLLGPDAGHLAEDPLWHALAALDGREPGTLPGTDLPDTEYFCLPLNWWAAGRTGPDDVYCWAIHNHRLRVWSENGFVLFEGPRDQSSPERQARQALGTYFGSTDSIKLSVGLFDQAPIAPLRSPLVRGLKPNLTRWLALVLPFIRFSLRRTLNPAASEEPDLKKILLMRQGRLYVTSTHVDLVMNLNDISVPIRLAGLDRNPGWLPDFARVLLFHFE